MTETAGFALIAIGSNATSHLRTRTEICRAAISEVADEAGMIRSVSRFYRTPAFPAGAGPDYVNAAFRLETELEPRALLAVLHGIELSFGRERTERWGQRTLDLDLLALDDRIEPDGDTVAFWQALPFEEQKLRAPDQLILPHPRMHERSFVLVPLADIAPGWVHPVLGKSVEALLAEVSAEDVAQVVPLA